MVDMTILLSSVWYVSSRTLMYQYFQALIMVEMIVYLEYLFH